MFDQINHSQLNKAVMECPSRFYKSGVTDVEAKLAQGIKMVFKCEGCERIF